VGPASPYVSKIRIKAKRAVHMGVAGVTVDHVNAPNQVVCPWLIDATNVFNPVGRILSAVGRPLSSTPFLSVTITGYDHTTGTLTVSPQAVVSGHPELSIQAGDVVVIRNKADALNNTTPTRSPTRVSERHLRLHWPDGRRGDRERPAGDSRHRTRPTTQDHGQHSDPTVLGPAAGPRCHSVWIVEAPAWDYTGDSSGARMGTPWPR